MCIYMRQGRCNKSVMGENKGTEEPSFSGQENGKNGRNMVCTPCWLEGMYLGKACVYAEACVRKIPSPERSSLFILAVVVLL